MADAEPPAPDDGAGAAAGAAAAAPFVGRILSDRYRVDALVAAGGMGAVYRGEHLRMRKRVAIKLLHGGAEEQPEIVARFEREAIAGAHVQHLNVAAATDFGEIEDGTRYLILELVEGVMLRDIVQRGPMPPARAVGIARQMASALEAIHDKGIVHRDIKPRNVLVDERDDRVKIIDFGLAKVSMDLLADASGRATSLPAQQLTAVGMVLGTVAYMAPEAALGMDAVDERADLYALGLVLYEMLAGQHPFDAEDPAHLFLMHKTATPPPLAQRAPGVVVPEPLERLVLRLLRKSRAERYQTAREVGAALDALELDHVAAAPPAPSAPDAPKLEAAVRDARSRSAKLPLIAAGALVATTAILLLALALRGDEDDLAADAPSAAPPPASAPLASATAREVAIEVDGLDAKAWRNRLRSTLETRHWTGGATAMLALAELDASAFRDPVVREAAVAVTAGIAFEENDAADRVYTLLTERLGNDGLDVLFEVVRSRGGTKAAKRALEILRRPDVRGRMPAAMRVTLDLRQTPCAERPQLYERAIADGDNRTLSQLIIMKDADCERESDACCFEKDRALADAIKQLKARLADR